LRRIIKDAEGVRTSTPDNSAGVSFWSRNNAYSAGSSGNSDNTNFDRIQRLVLQVGGVHRLGYGG
jgi:hypothetical protein